MRFISTSIPPSALCRAHQKASESLGEVKVKRKCGRPRNPIPRHKRTSHINAEHKRRGKIQDAFRTMKDLVPKQIHVIGRASKADILTSAVDYSKAVLEEMQSLSTAMDALKAEKEALTLDVKAYKVLVQDAPSREPKPAYSLDDLYTEYVQERSRNNQSFKIFSMATLPLFETFKKAVLCVTPESFVNAIWGWASDHLTADNLRNAFVSTGDLTYHGRHSPRNSSTSLPLPETRISSPFQEVVPRHPDSSSASSPSLSSQPHHVLPYSASPEHDSTDVLKATTDSHSQCVGPSPDSFETRYSYGHNLLEKYIMSCSASPKSEHSHTISPKSEDRSHTISPKSEERSHAVNQSDALDLTTRMTVGGHTPGHDVHCCHSWNALDNEKPMTPYSVKNSNDNRFNAYENSCSCCHRVDSENATFQEGSWQSHSKGDRYVQPRVSIECDDPMVDGNGTTATHLKGGLNGEGVHYQCSCSNQSSNWYRKTHTHLGACDSNTNELSYRAKYDRRFHGMRNQMYPSPGVNHGSYSNPSFTLNSRFQDLSHHHPDAANFPFGHENIPLSPHPSQQFYENEMKYDQSTDDSENNYPIDNSFNSTAHHERYQTTSTSVIPKSVLRNVLTSSSFTTNDTANAIPREIDPERKSATVESLLAQSLLSQYSDSTVLPLSPSNDSQMTRNCSIKSTHVQRSPQSSPHSSPQHPIASNCRASGLSALISPVPFAHQASHRAHDNDSMWTMARSDRVISPSVDDLRRYDLSPALEPLDNFTSTFVNGCGTRRNIANGFHNPRGVSHDAEDENGNSWSCDNSPRQVSSPPTFINMDAVRIVSDNHRYNANHFKHGVH